MTRLTAAEVVEDAQWLADSGEGMRATAHRMGMTTDALERSLQRSGEHTLVRLLRSRDTAPAIIGAHTRRTWATTPAGMARLAEYRRHYEHALALHPDPPSVIAGRVAVLEEALSTYTPSPRRAA